MFHLLVNVLESGILVPGMLIVWGDTNGCSKQYRCALDIYLITVLSSSYGIIMDRKINSPGHMKYVVDGINAMDKCYLEEEIELINKLGSKNTTNIGILTSDSKDVSIKFADQCLLNLNNKEILIGIKGITKMKKGESLFKYQ